MRIKNLTKEINGEILFKDVSFEINKNDKVGLIGRNGSGKTTLLNSIVNDALNECEYVELLKGEKIGYFKQEAKFSDLSLTVEEYIKKELKITEIEKRLKELELNLSTQVNLDEYALLQEQFIALDGYNFEYQLDKILDGFNLLEKKESKLEELSGGQRAKVLFAKILLEQPTILILDEPTNNLDLKSLEWLESYLLEYKYGILVVSHDREFLDKIVNRILEIDHINKCVIEYAGNYTEYKKQKEEKKRRIEEEYFTAQEKIKNLELNLKERKKWADKGRTQEVKDKDKFTRGYERDRSKSLVSDNKGTLKKIEKLEKKEKPIFESKLKLSFNLDKIRGNRDIFLNDVVVGFKDIFQTKTIKETIKFGDRVRIIGDNAKGKTTLLKTILGKYEPISGEINIGNALNIGYIPQNNIYIKEKDNTVNEILSKYVNKERDLGTIYGILNKFGIKYIDKDKKVSNLSPGEKTRLKLAEFSLKEINCIILDEVSNHLDIEAIEAIEEALEDFQGTIIIVSHDRRFVRNLNINKEIYL